MYVWEGGRFYGKLLCYIINFCVTSHGKIYDAYACIFYDQRTSHNQYYVAELADTGKINVNSSAKFIYCLPKVTDVNFVLQAVYQVCVLLVLNFRGRSLLNLKNDSSDANKVKNTLIFNAFVLCQVSDIL